jgi:hypothetical protein
MLVTSWWFLAVPGVAASPAIQDEADATYLAGVAARRGHLRGSDGGPG